MRYKETGNLHLDFHGSANVGIAFIAENFGKEALKELFSRVGKNVYKSIHRALKNDDPAELIEHFEYYLKREGGEYTLKQTDNQILLEIKRCPAVEQLRKMGMEISPYFCWQTIEVNRAICDGTPWKCKTEVIRPGECRQIFSRRKLS